MSRSHLGSVVPRHEVGDGALHVATRDGRGGRVSHPCGSTAFNLKERQLSAWFRVEIIPISGVVIGTCNDPAKWVDWIKKQCFVCLRGGVTVERRFTIRASLPRN